MAKFSRMGYQDGIARERIWMGRYGMVASNNPNVRLCGSSRKRWATAPSAGATGSSSSTTHKQLDRCQMRPPGDAAVQYAFIDGEIRHTTLPFHVFQLANHDDSGRGKRSPDPVA